MKTKLLSEQSYGAEITRIQHELDAVRESNTFERRAGEPIYYEFYRATQPKGWFAISHGFTESTVKFTEVIWYLVQEGYSVAICDHRGHGRSVRQVQEHWAVHVERFEDYSDDYAYFIEKVIVPQLNGLPLYLLGHSMGGAVAVHVVERFPNLPVQRLILSSPMIAPATGGIPRWITLLIARIAIACGKAKKNVFVHKPFDGKSDFGEEWCCASSVTRHAWYLELQRRNKLFQTSAATYQWLRESLTQTTKALNPNNTARVQIPVLLLQAGKDTMVLPDAQNLLVERLPNAKKIVFPDARHESFRGDNEQVERFMDEVLTFVAE